jgi:hypothetical protein
MTRVCPSTGKSDLRITLGLYQEAATDWSTFALISLSGKSRGLHACTATYRYIVPLPNIFLTRLFSILRLIRKDFQEIVRLTWAQEASGPNPDAPTKSPNRIIELACYPFRRLQVGNKTSPNLETASRSEAETGCVNVHTAGGGAPPARPAAGTNAGVGFRSAGRGGATDADRGCRQIERYSKDRGLIRRPSVP